MTYSTPGLRRELGKWDLTAYGTNSVIGVSVFILPAQVAAQFGNWSALAFLGVGLASLSVALCFAELASRFDRTGGPYLYARAAFGRFVAFEMGWLQWFTRVTSTASIANGVALTLGFYWPAMTHGIGRAALITALTLLFGWINMRGIRESALTINLFTICKLVPLVLFIGVGCWFIDAGRLSELGPVSLTQFSTGALLLTFAFAGYDVIGVPAGEAADPRRHVPFAIVGTIVAALAVMTLVQVVAMGTLPDISASSTPLADASHRFMGSVGGFLVTVGAFVSMTGTMMGTLLGGPRILFAMAENGELPKFLARIHPRYATPANAIMFSTALALVLGLSGSFVVLAVASAIGRLVLYTVTCAATLQLRRARFQGVVAPATFTAPLGSLLPVLAIGASLIILVGATTPQLVGGTAALAAGALLFATSDQLARRRARAALASVATGPAPVELYDEPSVRRSKQG